MSLVLESGKWCNIENMVYGPFWVVGEFILLYKGKSFYYGAGDGSTVVARADNKK